MLSFGINLTVCLAKIILKILRNKFSGAMVEEMCASDKIDEVVVFFYNPNIHPKREYEIRKVRTIPLVPRLQIGWKKRNI